MLFYTYSIELFIHDRDFSMQAFLNTAVEAARKAGDIAQINFARINQSDIKTKAYNEFATFVDEEAEKAIIEIIHSRYPDHTILAEEQGLTGDESDYLWIIDPIDGTTNFMHGIPHFAISLALKSKNEIIAGVIYDPIKDEIFYGEKNSGAYLNNHRIRVSKRKNINQSLFASGDKNLSQYNNINIRKSGSAALDLAYVACGRYEGYFQKNLSIWDIAAGLIILKEAGGIISELNINNQTNLKIIASNPYINENLLNILSKF